MKDKNYYNKMSYDRFMFVCIFIVGTLIALYLVYDYNSKFRFSVKSGFYEDAFELEILGNKNYDVYYTLDCSTPTVESIKYDGPIHIDDRTPEVNEYSDRYDVSTGYYSEDIEAYSYDEPDPGYVLPQYDVD